MSKSTLFSNPAFQKQETAVPIGFNLVTQTNNFNSVFNIRPLETTEAASIEKLLAENFLPGSISDEQVGKDADELKIITAEIKAIGKQGIVLMGERVHKAREILKPYRDGTFTKWIEKAFGARKTGYNMLSYFELYNALPSPLLKEKLKKIPQKAAYILASRLGDIEVKAEIINDYYDQGANEIIALIQEKIPLMSKDKRSYKDAHARLIASLFKEIKKLAECKKSLSEENRNSLFMLRELLDIVLD